MLTLNRTIYGRHMSLNRYHFITAMLIIAAVFFLISPCHAKKNITKELADAQALLAKGEYDTAFQVYHHFATQEDNPLAQFTIGLFYKLGWGRPVDPSKACEWFEKAGNNQVPTAIHYFAECLRRGTGGAASNPAKAAKWYEKSAGLGYHISLCSLAELYMSGNGVLKNPEKALELCQQAAEKRIVPAQIQMGRFLLDKDSGVQDFRKAFEWFSMAAQMDAPEAQYYTGLMFRKGLGQPKNPENALYWFEKAAVNGYEKAYLPVGELYFSGARDPETGMLPAANLAKSYLWLSAAMRQTSDTHSRNQAKKLMEKVLDIMPPTWKPDLDAKVDKHFQSFPSDQP